LTKEKPNTIHIKNDLLNYSRLWRDRARGLLSSRRDVSFMNTAVVVKGEEKNSFSSSQIGYLPRAGEYFTLRVSEIFAQGEGFRTCRL
jgi:hypothetical protein